MFKTLFTKLTAVLLALLCLIGLLYIGLSFFSTRMYVQEVNQKLNHTLAQHLVSEKILIEGGHVNQAALEDLFQMLMVINPSIEIYLLDAHGRILACSAPLSKLHRKHVALPPLKAFLSGTDTLPILGDDPQDSARQKVFSVAPIPIKAATQRILSGPVGGSGLADDQLREGPVAGYLYVVLGGKAYDSAAQMLQGSYILRLSTWMIAASVAFALLAGLLLFKFLTRKLTRLTEAMESFKRTDFLEPAAISEVKLLTVQEGDEIDRLGAAFNEMAQRIQHQMQCLQETDALRRELVANVSHDLRTPITSLQGYLETLLLKETHLSPEQKRSYLEIALRHSERLGKLVTELFELAKLDAQITPLNPEPFSIGELVQDVVQEFQLTARQKGVYLDLEIHKELEFVCADIGLMQRVLENLIENALHYTPTGGRVTVSVSCQDNAIAVKIADTGCGIPDADLPHIFDRFYRVEKAREDHSEGAGLGLAIAKRILDLHGITIQVESQIDEGTTFSFQLAAHSC